MRESTCVNILLTYIQKNNPFASGNTKITRLSIRRYRARF